jgi:putative DNA primase/helicase
VQALIEAGEMGTNTAAQFVTNFAARLTPFSCDGQVQRVAHRFALIAAAGEMAIQFGVLPFAKRAAEQAAERTFHAWFAKRGGSDRREDQVAVALISEFLQRFGRSRFAPMTGEVGSERVIPDLAGWRRGEEFLINTATWQEIMKGHDPRAVAHALASKGYLRRDQNGKNAVLITVQGHKQRAYAISANILEAGGC